MTDAYLKAKIVRVCVDLVDVRFLVAVVNRRHRRGHHWLLTIVIVLGKFPTTVAVSV